jgi:hypothetical protein
LTMEIAIMLAEIVRDTAFMAFALWFGIRLGRYRS